MATTVNDSETLQSPRTRVETPLAEYKAREAFVREFGSEPQSPGKIMEHLDLGESASPKTKCPILCGTCNQDLSTIADGLEAEKRLLTGQPKEESDGPPPGHVQIGTLRFPLALIHSIEFDEVDINTLKGTLHLNTIGGATIKVPASVTQFQEVLVCIQRFHSQESQPGDPQYTYTAPAERIYQVMQAAQEWRKSIPTYNKHGRVYPKETKQK